MERQKFGFMVCRLVMLTVISAACQSSKAAIQTVIVKTRVAEAIATPAQRSTARPPHEAVALAEWVLRMYLGLDSFPTSNNEEEIAADRWWQVGTDTEFNDLEVDELWCIGLATALQNPETSREIYVGGVYLIGAQKGDWGIYEDVGAISTYDENEFPIWYERSWKQCISYQTR